MAKGAAIQGVGVKGKRAASPAGAAPPAGPAASAPNGLEARVRVYPRREVLDPQGRAIREALGRLGFEGVGEVRAGKSFDLSLSVADPAAARALVEDICRRLLANPVVEDFEIELAEGRR